MRGKLEWVVGDRKSIKIARDKHGVPHVRASSEEDLYRGLGHCHGRDRAMQMLLVRILAQGRASELLSSDPETLVLDSFFRRVNLANGVEAEVAKISRCHLTLAQAYCDGVNLALRQRLPWEFKLLSYKPPPWTVADCILVSRIIGYVALSQSQADIERLVLEMVQAQVPEDKLEELFPGLLKELDLTLLRKVRLGERLVPRAVRWNNALPRALASNNWVISGKKTASLSPILANDPHLEANRLPAVWYEIVLQLGRRFCIASTMPGVPGLLLGRTNDLAWGATYTFMDAIDSWIEDCRDGRFKRLRNGVEEWVPFNIRKEVIKRRKKPEVTLTFYENQHGILDGDPFDAGLYLATQWSGATGTGPRSLAAFFGMLQATDVRAGMELLGQIETSWNWVLADTHGNIGYQMSGLMPIRPSGHNGLLPLPGWDPSNDWQGFVPPQSLPRTINPEEGFIVTANNDLNHLGKVHPVNLPMGPYRAERIASLLAEHNVWTVEDTRKLQMDLYSPQAEQFMAILRPLLPEGQTADLLRQWGHSYEPESHGAYLFESFYRELLVETFGSVCGEDVFQFLTTETGVLADFYYNFDRVLLKEKSSWFGPEGRDRLFQRAAKKALATPAKSWGSKQQLIMKHLVLGGRLPTWLGFDYGPVALPGSRATIQQGQIYRAGGRDTSFAPSYRLVTDLSQPVAHTALAGGPSDRRFSPWYTSGIRDWIDGRLKLLKPESQPART